MKRFAILVVSILAVLVIMSCGNVSVPEISSDNGYSEHVFSELFPDENPPHEYELIPTGTEADENETNESNRYEPIPPDTETDEPESVLSEDANQDAEQYLLEDYYPPIEYDTALVEDETYSDELPLYYPPYDAAPQDETRRFLIAIDPGHQARGDYTREPNGPGSSTYKARVSSGTRGIATGVPEYRFVLEMSLLLRDELTARGFDVFLIRETNDVNISNSERAIAASEAGADIFLRIHANGSANQDAHGIMTLTSSRNNPYIPHLYEESRALSEAILREMAAVTGARNLGVLVADNMTGNNWSSIPVTIIEMGFMTNPAEDELMQTEDYQRKLVQGMADGVERFFAER